MLIRKTLSLADVGLTLKMSGDTGTFEGYASKWGGVDSYGDTIVKGAFAETLAKNGQPKLYLEHSWKLGGALLPIGKAFCEEDSVGLFIKGELTPGLTVANDVHAAMKHGTIDGISVGGLIKAGDYEENAGGGRIIKKWNNLFDVSITTHPADNQARVDLSTVKSIDFETLLPECKSEKEIERLLRDAGLGKWEAMAIISRVRAIVKGSDSQQEAPAMETALILERIRRLSA